MKISISGKGGSGKTTLAGILARAMARQGVPVLALDGDSNPSLGAALGVPPLAEPAPHPSGELLKEVPGADGKTTRVLALPVSEIVTRYGTAAPDGVRLLSLIHVDHAGKG